MREVTVEANKPWVITYKGKQHTLAPHFTKRAAIERFLMQRFLGAEDGHEVELELDGQLYICEACVETTWEITTKDWE